MQQPLEMDKEEQSGSKGGRKGRGKSKAYLWGDFSLGKRDKWTPR